ncbi:MAG: hypothetical protein M0P99_00705 [Candidatus Cloacimonetes bacterium]|nr:hypothetical protein [Candidatus Cloacimonadota bacterium]
MENVTDSVSTRIVFDNVLNKLLPFIAASKSELIMYEFSSNIRTTDIRYHQIVDGYPIEGSGFINIAYDKNRDLFTILNATVNVQQKPASINLSLKQAMEIVKNYYVRNRD